MSEIQLLRLTLLLTERPFNYKLAGSGGFSPHIDSTAYTHVKNIKHLTILMAVDASNMSNGGLEVVEGSHSMDVPIDSSNCIEKSWVEKERWVPVELEAGKRSHPVPSILPVMTGCRTVTHFRIISRAPEWSEQQQLGSKGNLCNL